MSAADVLRGKETAAAAPAAAVAGKAAEEGGDSGDRNEYLRSYSGHYYCTRMTILVFHINHGEHVVVYGAGMSVRLPMMHNQPLRS